MKLCKAMVQLESQGAFKDSTPGKKCKELFHCSGLGNNCQLRQGKDGCSTCFCADACPEIFCGTHCRRVLTEGHCPFCDCRRGQQIYIKGVKPSPQPYTLAPYTRPFDINEKQEFE
ncbi:uncharacterized protein LOC111249316 isoform X2 [Varroa destructor]|uniref:Uncharacterized protein n=1 Tax=Varroa destructor TaxID=109461 RepID=A0A7M7JY36_VARDE|nr:uncharacterized protein LOC111249316 isoform X2 [Varroa destructor]